ncbi:unnamed protein product [Toxocara canis]|uniref:WD_REPEATS_REGION domain-containing protein n=1 Tax=Toxocara canis TaxID=6265 RepID=A0A183UMM1_TOXCA|nr:unnamed protein product [Toxocara canis]
MIEWRTDPPVATWFQESRHVEKIVGVKEEIEERDTWRRYSKERMKTVSVALVLCLNIGVDPPDVQKPNPCARQECWIDPHGMNPQKAIAKIASALQKNYERWQPRARYKNANDPTVEDVRRLCQSMRRNAKDERVLFHYNGHGVPRPTENGEIWVFNKNFTQYIPLSIFDLQSWMSHPSIYVWDCNSAGLIVRSFNRFADDHEKEWVKQLDEHMETRPPPLPVIQAEMKLEEKARAFGFRKKPNFKECIQLAACSEDELLPMDPDLPADLFTSCLTTPIQISVLWYIIRNDLKDRFPLSIVDKIPGQLTDRRTLLGELNWIFTAITDTIAWNALPKELFQKLFRLDLLLASLFRSFLLAERIMRANQCHVVSRPALPSVYDHPLWDAWDYTLDLCLSQMYESTFPTNKLWALGKEIYFTRSSMRYNVLVDVNSEASSDEIADYTHNWFFIDQLQAFEVWLKYGIEQRQPPQQLPVVLQVLLSQVHRVKALELLARFLDLGSWAVGHALSVGIFPYVLKLLQSATKELRPWLAFIWAKILAVEPSCQVDLIKDKDRGYMYFIQILNDPHTNPRQKIVPAYVTAALIENNYKPAQELLTENRYVTLCIELLSDTALGQCRLLRLWLLIGLGRLWADHNDARWQAIRLVAYERVLEFLDDTVPEVRAAAVYSLGCLVRNRSENNEHATTIDHEVCDKLSAKCTFDGSVLVRAELVVAMQWFIVDFENRFANLMIDLDEKIEKFASEPGGRKYSGAEQGLDHVLLVISEEDGHERTKFPPVSGHGIATFRTLPRHKSSTAEAIPTLPRRSNSMNLDPLVENTPWPNQESPGRDFSPLFVPKKRLSKEDAFKSRAVKQMRLLESKTFKEQSERIWLSLLRLSLDPVKKIAEMAQVLIEHVEQLASSKHRKLSTAHVHKPHPRTVSDNILKEEKTAPVKEITNGNEPVTFTIGSPVLASNSLGGPSAPNGHVRKLSESSSVSERQRTSSKTKLDVPPSLPIFHQSAIFTPKRNMYTPTIKSLSKLELENSFTAEPVPALVSTEFVPWCAKRFTEPILDMIQGQAGDGLSDRLAVKSLPSDWAFHKDEGLLQTAKHEIHALTNMIAQCDTQQLFVRSDREATSLVWSQLRPHLYSCDGRMINIWRWEAQKALCVRRFNSADGNPFVDDVVCEMHILNEMTRELLMTGSDNGMVRVWDPCYSIHSHEFEAEPCMITATYLLKDVPRTPADKPETTVYSWNQRSGRILTSGNVRLCRIWDVHAEQTAQDIQIGAKSCLVTKICSDDSCSELIALGLNDGSVNLYDPRIPGKSQRVMSLRELQRKIVGLSFISNASASQADNGLRLVVGSEDGEIRVWEPRMFQEPIVQLNACEELKGKEMIMPKMEVQPFGQLMGCATVLPAMRIFDISGKQLTDIRYNDAFVSGAKVGLPTALRFHQLRVSVAIATRERFISAYGMPSTY